MEESDLLLIAENIVAGGWSSALAKDTSIEVPNLAPLQLLTCPCSSLLILDLQD